MSSEKTHLELKAKIMINLQVRHTWRFVLGIL